MKKILLLFIALSMTFQVYAADQKLTALTGDLAPTSDDLIYVVVDVATTAVERKVLLSDLPISDLTQTEIDTKEDDLGNPVTNGFILSSLTDGTRSWIAPGAGSGDVSASAVIADHSLVRGDGGAKGVQDSGIIIDDSDNMSGVASITLDPSTDPTITLKDSDYVAGTGKIYSNSGGGVNDVILYIGVEDSTGESTHYIEVDGVSETIDMLKPTTLQAGDIIKADLATDSVDYTKTEGSYKASSLVGDPDTWDITPALHNGGFMIASAAGEDTLDAAVIGMNLSLSARDTIAAIWNPNVADTIIRNGVSLAQGEALISDNTAGVYSLATCVVVAANTWECSCSDGVTEETP